MIFDGRNLYDPATVEEAGIAYYGIGRGRSLRVGLLSSNDSSWGRRLDDMEVRLTFIDDAVQALTDADAEQSQRIVALERALRDLRSELASVRLGHGDDAQSEPPPPHY